MNISLPAPMKAWVEERAASGRYANSSDLIRDLIRREQERLEAVAELQALVDEAGPVVSSRISPSTRS